MGFVKYIGTANLRLVTHQDWVLAKVPNQDTVVWEPANGFSVPLSSFSDAALRAIEADGSFVIVGERGVEAPNVVTPKHVRERVAAASAGPLDADTDL